MSALCPERGKKENGEGMYCYKRIIKIASLENNWHTIKRIIPLKRKGGEEKERERKRENMEAWSHHSERWSRAKGEQLVHKHSKGLKNKE